MYKGSLLYEDSLQSTSYNSGYEATAGNPAFAQIAFCNFFYPHDVMPNSRKVKHRMKEILLVYKKLKRNANALQTDKEI